MEDTMPLYTRSGDAGITRLYGGGRTSKSAPRIHAIGAVDELSALLGVVLAESVPEELREQLVKVQHALYMAGADLAIPLRKVETRVTEDAVAEVERWIDEAEGKVPQLRHFILPGGTRVGALLHQARTVCRRAERWVFALAEVEGVNGECLKYLNRLGDFLFAVARVVNRENGVEEMAVGI